MACICDDSLGILVSDVTRLFWRRLEATFAAEALDFTAGEARVLLTLVDLPGLKQNQLAERLHIEPMTLVGFLDRLALKGMVERTPDPNDRRAKLVNATAAGRDTAVRLRAASSAVKETMEAGLDPAETAILRRALLEMRGNLAEACGKGGRA